jgi:hypothetical protein
MLEWDEEVQEIFIILLDLDFGINAMTEYLSEYFFLQLFKLKQQPVKILDIRNLIKKKYNMNSIKRTRSLISSRYDVSKFFFPSNLKHLYSVSKNDQADLTYIYNERELTTYLAEENQILIHSTYVNLNPINDYQLSPLKKIFLNKNDRQIIPKARNKQNKVLKEKAFKSTNLFNSSRFDNVNGSEYLQDINFSDIFLLTTDLSLKEIFSANLLEVDLLKLKLNENPLFYFLQTYNQGLFVYYSDYAAPESLFENLNFISKMVKNKKTIHIHIKKQRNNLINSRITLNPIYHNCYVTDFFLYNLEFDRMIKDDNKSTLLSLLYVENYNCKRCCSMLIMKSKLNKQNFEHIDESFYLYAKNSFNFYISKRFKILKKLTGFIDE